MFVKAGSARLVPLLKGKEKKPQMGLFISLRFFSRFMKGRLMSSSLVESPDRDSDR